MSENDALSHLLFGRVRVQPDAGPDPPGWWIFGVYLLNHDAELPLLIVAGATGAASGRFLLAHATRLLGGRFLTSSARGNMSAVRKAIESRHRNSLISLGIFAVSPIPSAQLFEAAGLAGLRLLPLTVVFFSGRLVAYSLYAYTVREISETTSGDILCDEMFGPVGVALQVSLYGCLVLLTKIDWHKRLENREADGDDI